MCESCASIFCENITLNTCSIPVLQGPRAQQSAIKMKSTMLSLESKNLLWVKTNNLSPLQKTTLLSLKTRFCAMLELNQ